MCIRDRHFLFGKVVNETEGRADPSKTCLLYTSHAVQMELLPTLVQLKILEILNMFQEGVHLEAQPQLLLILQIFL